jgi:hypothetical protein
MRALQISLGLISLLLASSAQAAVKFYDSSIANGEPTDSFAKFTVLCPPVQTFLDNLEGYHHLSDDGLGTVTLEEFVLSTDSTFDSGPNDFVPFFGPGAFFFLQQNKSTTIAAPASSNTSGVGAHGPSGTAPGESVEWGIVSGFEVTGFTFCISSPVDACNENNFSHGSTIPAAVNSTTYDLGTWSFDAVGDLNASPYIEVTSTGGQTNNTVVIQGTFHGANLPALPLVGFGALAVALAAIGGRALAGKK